jgi:cephalosporin-C deacetylase-like acetyl esterase
MMKQHCEQASERKPWPEERKEVERRWLDLLGEFPKEVPEPHTEMKEVERKDAITRYHVSFQSEPDDRVTAWLLVPDLARNKPTPAISRHVDVCWVWI